MKWGPTTANSQPQRIVFIRSDKAKDRLRPALSSSNVKKTLSAPVVALLAYDMRFFEHLPRLYSNPQARSWYETTPEAIRTTALRNVIAAGRLLHDRGARARARLRPDVRLQQRQGRCRVLPGRPLQVELPVLSGLRRRVQSGAAATIASRSTRCARCSESAAPNAAARAAASACRSVRAIAPRPGAACRDRPPPRR